METDGTGALKPALQGVPQIDSARCTGCGRCVAACPQKIITLEVSGYSKHAVIRNTERCSLCGCCVTICPVEAIRTS
ncbi:MAG: 4Fe-4S binding protein [Desulfuromonadaceae bacterium]|nr:4Fe-4S binding protein [Desulfuromonadaceae bacterium]